MDIKSFQKKLAEILELARYNNRRLEAGLVEKFFGEEGLAEGQLENVFEYLRAQGIHILHDGEEEEREQLQRPETEQKEPDPLSEEEEAYLRDYLESMGAEESVDEAAKAQLFEKAKAGDSQARQELAAAYLPELVGIVRQMHREEIFAGDMLQEGMIGLLSALEREEKSENCRECVLEAVRSAIQSMISKYQEQKWEDDCLVNRVEKLEAAVRELTDDAGDKFSVEELSAFLDMSMEEIQDILRLTGDDK